MTFEELLQDPNVLYIYEIGPQIYGLFEGVDRRKFLVICNDGFEPEIESTREKEYTIKRISDLFQEVISGQMLPWMCACLNKKFVHKEHVKLIMTTNPLQLRKDWDILEKEVWKEIESVLNEQQACLTAEKDAWSLYRYLNFANQIIDNHKIVNFKTVSSAYIKLVQGEHCDLESLKKDWHEICNAELKLFKSKTDEILKADKIKKILQNENL